MNLLLPLLGLIYAVFNSEARPDGAPTSACTTLTPVHGDAKPQQIKSPYAVSVIKTDGKYQVIISSPIGEEFMGFMLQARSKNDLSKFIDGEFTTTSTSRTTDCFEGNENTLTHKDTSSKKTVVTEWMPKENKVEDVVFRATVAKTFSIFWTEVDSKEGVMPDTGKNSNTQSAYGSCYVTKGCFGLPSGCVEKGDCEVLVTYSSVPSGIEFGLQGYLQSSTYMAMGLSHDGKMGEDVVTECIRDGDSVIARESWNEGKSNTRTKDLPKHQYSSSYTNGLSSCSFLHPYVFGYNGHTYNLEKNIYFILLAKGGVDSGRLKYHSDKIASTTAVNFTTFETIEGEGVTSSVKIHGTFMVTAWVGFVSLAILLARHYKNDWEDRTLGGVKIWFALHRAFMISALLLVIVAFIVIFIHKNGWNYETSNPHAILGCIATSLGLSNPIMAAFRPAPSDPKRPIFNWLHWGVGNSAQILAVIAIFFAVSLQSSGLDNRFYWIMANFVLGHLIIHLVHQIHAWTRGRKKNNEMALNEMNGARSYNVSNEQATQGKDKLDNKIRNYMLTFYTVFIVVILITSYTLIGMA